MSRLDRIRHSLAHILAQAVLEMRPGSHLGFGPPIEDGFYYDFLLSAPLAESDLPELEARMRAILDQDAAFVQEDLPGAEALERIAALGEPYKREYAQELMAKKGLQSLSFYRSGSFVDMCEGPHVARASDIPRDCFKLRSLAGAYWRGDSRNPMMTRIYAWAHESVELLEESIRLHTLALERDHKKLGRELEIFLLDDEIGKGLPLWLPNGTVIRDELEKLMRELEFEAGYQRVVTPHLARSELYRKSGHLPYYAREMYPALELREEGHEGSSVVESYHLRPMNCPHHHKIFGSRKRSYRELPLRLAEFGQVYRFENSGSLSGILRVRGLCQNDAHLYCSEEQVPNELAAVLSLYRRAYGALGIEDLKLRLSLRDSAPSGGGKEKYVENPEAWEKSQNLLREALVKSGLEFEEVTGEAAFYGPKVDVQLRSVTGREETASTIQLDFTSAGRMGLSYVGKDNLPHVPWIIHRAPLGSHERMVAFLLERFGGAFPTWLAPIQARVLSVAEPFSEYAQVVESALRSRGIRADRDHSSERLGKQILRASQEKIPNLLIVGQREKEEGTVTVRRRGVAAQLTLPLEELVKAWALEIQERRN